MIRFTDISLRTLKVGFYLDERTPAFGIRIGKNRKTWLVLKEPNRTKVRLGHYPAISLADARKKALVALGSPHEQTFAPTFPDTRTEYLAQGKWRPYSRYQVTRTLTRHFHWTKTIDKITHRDVAEAIEVIKA
ncbi:MAG TPA: Arm DNA-binding domain-containing protein, partial [Methylocella sp.]|nr:Arm DNA-binding domain-containing protein [Methylocella sp.]